MTSEEMPTPRRRSRRTGPQSDDVKARLEFYVKKLQFDIRTIHKLLDKCDEVHEGSYLMCVVRMDKCLNMLLATMTEIGVQIDYPRCPVGDTECPPGVLDLSDTSMLRDERRPPADTVAMVTVDPFSDW